MWAFGLRTLGATKSHPTQVRRRNESRNALIHGGAALPMRGFDIRSFSEYQTDPQKEEQHAKASLKPCCRQMLGPHPAKISADGKAQSDHQSRFEINVAGFVILP